MKKIWIILISIGVLAFIFGILFFIKGNVEVSLVGDAMETTTYKEEYHDKGIKFLRNGKELSKDRYKVVETNNIDINTLGEYEYKYVINYLWNKYTLIRKVKVVDDVKPEITVNVEKLERDYCTKKDKNKLTYTAMDNYDGDVTEKITVSEKEEELIVSVTDTNGNTEDKIVPIVYTKKPDPVFKVKGNTTVYVALNGTYKESGATYQDGCGNEIKETIQITGTVDTKKTGTYTITYSLQNGKKITRKVVVYNPATQSSGGSKKEKIIYLTFDDGPGQYTEKVLNTLAKYNVKATFFVTHQFGKYVPLIKKEYDAGHAVGVHTYTHNFNVYKSVDAYVNDFNKMNDDILKYTGSKARIFRFPGGSSNTVSRKYSKGVVKAIASRMTSDGYVYFDWDVDSGDAAGASRKKIYNNVVNGVKRCTKCIVLMHDIKPNTVNELDNILKTLTSQGYKFGKLSPSSPTVHHTIVN